MLGTAHTLSISAPCARPGSESRRSLARELRRTPVDLFLVTEIIRADPRLSRQVLSRSRACCGEHEGNLSDAVVLLGIDGLYALLSDLESACGTAPAGASRTTGHAPAFASPLRSETRGGMR
jgi:hypothetical protein